MNASPVALTAGSGGVAAAVVTLTVSVLAHNHVPLDAADVASLMVLATTGFHYLARRLNAPDLDPEPAPVAAPVAAPQKAPEAAKDALAHA